MAKFMIVILSMLSIFGCRSTKEAVPPVKIPEGDSIVLFELNKTGGMRPFGGYTYLVEETKDGRVHFLFNENYPDEKELYTDDHSVFDTLDQIVRKYRMDLYQDQYMPDERIFDGFSWSLYVRYASRTTVRSGGYMAGPDNWPAARNELLEYLDRWKNLPGISKDLVSFQYSYGPRHYLVQKTDDHTLVTVDDDTENVHNVLEMEPKMMEDLQYVAVTEGLRVNGTLKSDDPESIPFKFILSFSNGDHYEYESYDLNYKCHYTEVIQWFFRRWEIDASH